MQVEAVCADAGARENQDRAGITIGDDAAYE
jgi:hypothetical protein